MSAVVTTPHPEAEEGGTEPLLTASARLLERVRARTPLVQCLTNHVVTGFTANALLALGASPAMVDVPGESGPFAGVADGVLVNLGTPGAEQREAIREAVAAAVCAGTPWVLDPVAVGALPVRTALAAELAEQSPAIVRGNASEVRAMAGAASAGRGVDSGDDSEAALDAAVELARRTGAVVAVSGATDVVTDGDRVVRVGGGHPLLTRVTGGGCALGASMAAFAGVVGGDGEDDDDRGGEGLFEAAVAASVLHGVAGELAARHAHLPGSFAVAFLDALADVGVDGPSLVDVGVLR